MPKYASLTYPYKPRLWLFLIGFILFGAGGYYFGQEALTNETAYTLVFNRFIELDMTQGEAKVMLWVISVMSTLFALGSLYGIYDNLTSTSVITLTEESLIIPWKNVFKKVPRAIMYKDIEGLEIVKVSSNLLLKIIHHQGEDKINATFLKNKQTLEELMTELTKRGGLKKV